MVGVGRINMAVPKPHAGARLSWVQEVCPSAKQLGEQRANSPIDINWGTLRIMCSAMSYLSDLRMPLSLVKAF